MQRLLVAQGLVAGVCVALGALLLVPTALAAGPATTVAVSLSPPSIAANGSSTSTATAIVTDASGTRVPSDPVTFSSSDPGQAIAATTDHGDGSYTATITSSTTPGPSTITATDASATPNVTGTATLTQFGPAAHLTLSLAPSSIPADGASTSTATATLTDADGNRVVGDTINFTSDGGQNIAATTDHGDGTYTATITSTTRAGESTITATDSSAPGVSGQATLTQTPGPAATVSLGLSPPSIVANGVSTSTATATVTDANGNPVSGDSVAIRSDGPQQVTPATDNGDGTYTATITSTTRAGQSTITADDSTAGVSGQATLTQTPGPARTVSVTLSPPSIVADGASTTLATATVTDANGNAVPGDSVMISSSSGQSVAAADRGDGSYAAQIHSSTTPGPVTITATDTSTGASGEAQLGQTAGSSTTSLGASPASPVANEVVTLVATVSTGRSSAPMSGSVTFANFGGPIGGSCSDAPVSSSKPTVTCRVSFSADASPEHLTATFTPDANSAVAGSTGSITLPIGRDSTLTSLATSNRSPAIRRTTHYTATVRSRHAGFAQPTGSVQFLDGTKVIPRCSRQPLRASGGAPTATCSVTYRSPGTHKIVARYLGNRDFATSSSSVMKVSALRAITSKLRWSFKSTRAYTNVIVLMVKGVPAGSKVVTMCQGQGCPFARRTTSIKTSRQGQALDLSGSFARRRLSLSAKVMVEIVRANWIGKYYAFVVRSGQAPSAQVSCLAPGSTKPGVGCQA